MDRDAERSPEHRQLMHDLMLLGWYWTGYSPTPHGDGRLWHFRHGHLTDGTPGPDLTIKAASEWDAMRALLTQLRHAGAELVTSE